MIKKITALILVVAFGLLLVGCQDGGTKEPPKPTPLEDSPDPSTDDRALSVYESERIIIDNTNKEFTYKQASTYKYNAGQTAIGDNFMASEKRCRI